MKKMISSLLIAGMLIGSPITTGADEDLTKYIGLDYLVDVEATAYCNPDGNLTATGRKTTEGLTVATCKEWNGCTIYIWLEGDDGYEFYGIYESMDTGGDYRIKAGKCVDIYFDSKEDAIAFGRQKSKIQIVRSVG